MTCPSVFCRARCDRCGRFFRAQVDFYTPSSFFRHYRVGERVGELDELPPNTTYTGQSSRYCGRCLLMWEREEIRLWYEILARWVDSGRLSIVRRTSGEAFSAADIRYNGEWESSLWRGRGECTLFTSWPDSECEVTWLGQMVPRGGEPDGRFRDALYSDVAEELRHLRWVSVLEVDRPAKVSVDGDLRLWVTFVSSDLTG